MTEQTAKKRVFNYRKILMNVLQVAIIGLLVWYLVENRAAFAALGNIRWQHIVLIILLDTAAFLMNGFINFLMLRTLDPRIGLLDCILLQYVNNLLNKVLPTIGGGAAFRAYYLKRVYQFPYTQFASTVAGLYVISFSSTALIGMLCLLKIYFQLGVFNWIIFLAFAGLLFITLAVILFSPQIPERDNRWLRALKNMVDSWNKLKKEPKILVSYLGLSILLLLLTAAYSYVGYEALGVKTSLTPMLYLSTLGIIMAFLNFTPDGIGVKEGIYVFSKDLVQIPQDLLVLGSLYMRGISIITTFVIGGISYWFLRQRLKKCQADPNAWGQ